MKRRTILQAGAALSCGLSGCLETIGSPSPSAEGSPCPETVPRIENADFDGEFEMRCNSPSQSKTETGGTTMEPDPRSAAFPDPKVTFTLTNRRDRHFNADFYNWVLQKRVDGRWYVTTARIVSGDGEGASLAPGASHEWTVTVSNDNLGEPVDPVEGNESLSLRALGAGTYAFAIVGSYGEPGESGRANQPLVGYAAQFTLEGDSLPLVATNSVRDVTRDGDAVTVTMGSGQPDESVTYTRLNRTPTATATDHVTYITESVYGKPVLRNALAHFEDGVEQVTVRTSDAPLQTNPPQGWTFTYAGTAYRTE